MKKYFAYALALILCCVSCDSLDLNGGVQYIPFQSQEDGRWGMISMDGKVLFEEEFKEQPTIAVNGRFIVKNSKDLYEIYTAEKKPRQVGEAYKQVGLFYEDVAPAVKEGKPVCLIDRDGNVVKELKTLRGETVLRVFNFLKGFALFETEDELYGVIDAKGNVIVEPKYAECSWAESILYGGQNYDDQSLDTRTIVFDEKWDKHFYASPEGGEINQERSYVQAKILDMANGKETKTTNISFENFEDVEEFLFDAFFKDGYCVLANLGKRENGFSGIIDDKGEWVVYPKTDYRVTSLIGNKQFVFENADGQGLATFDGEMLIRPKYSELRCATDELLIARDDTKESGECEFLMDKNGNRVGNDGYMSILGFFGDDNAIVRIDDNEYGFIDKEGKLLKTENNTDIYNVGTDRGFSYVESDYVDMEALVDKFALAGNGIGGFVLGTTPEKTVEAVKALETGSDDIDVSTCVYNCSLDFYNYSLDLGAGIGYPEYRLIFGDFMAEQTGYFYNDVAFNNTHGLKGIRIMLSCSYGRLEGKLPALLDAVKARVSKVGKIVKEDDYSFIASIGRNTLSVEISGNEFVVNMSDEAYDDLYNDIDSVVYEEPEGHPADTTVVW
jgi:hypothetical protein